MLVLEELQHARSRGAKIYGEILGWASTCDAYHMMGHDPSCEEMVRAIKLALSRSGVAERQVSFIKAHAAGERILDALESKAIRLALGDRACQIPISSLKGMLGHAQGACGAIELVGSLISMKESFVPPTINFETPDLECNIDCVPNTNRRHRVGVALNNSFAFGGNNACLVLSKCNCGS